MSRVFKVPFAVTGDRENVPTNTQPDGKVSYEQGFGYDYQRPYDDPDAKDISRESFNGLLFDVTDAIGEMQIQGAATWSQDGAPYPINALVRHEGKLWQSKVENNNAQPAEGSNWTEVVIGDLAKSADLPTAGTGLEQVGKDFRVRYGTSAGTAVQGNDSRIVNALQRGNDLSDITNPATARSNLGLKGAATRDVVSSPTDTSGGNKVVTQGWMGLGKDSEILADDQSASISDLVNGFWFIGGNHTENPVSGSGRGVNIISVRQNSNFGSQIALVNNTDQVFVRTRPAGSWREIHHTGNILKTTGNNDNFPMSQKAVTDALNNIIVAPIGMCYTQYPGTDTPSTLFGGTWTLMFNTEGVFFRTEGQGAISFGGGVQEDALQGHGHAFRYNNTSVVSDSPGTGAGIHTSNTSKSAENRVTNPISLTGYGSVRYASETRPRNRTIRVWRKTAH